MPLHEQFLLLEEDTLFILYLPLFLQGFLLEEGIGMVVIIRISCCLFVGMLCLGLQVLMALVNFRTLQL
jgi:hypothetical protein